MKKVFALIFVAVIMFQSSFAQEKQDTNQIKNILQNQPAPEKIYPCLQPCWSLPAKPASKRTKVYVERQPQEALFTIGNIREAFGLFREVQDSKVCCPEQSTITKNHEAIYDKAPNHPSNFWDDNLLLLLGLLIGGLLGWLLGNNHGKNSVQAAAPPVTPQAPHTGPLVVVHTTGTPVVTPKAPTATAPKPAKTKLDRSANEL